MAYLIAQGPEYELVGESDGTEDISVRLCNEASENGMPNKGPFSWLNSARVTADSNDDAIHCVVSIGDPRGGFCFTVRRLSDGRIVIHTPHPGEGMAHMETKSLHPGTLQVEGNFADDNACDGLRSHHVNIRLTPREQVIEDLEGIGVACFDDESTELLREAWAESACGDIPCPQCGHTA